MKLNKIILLISFLLTACINVFSQKLEIHHINVHDGDATVIRVISKSDTLLAKILIDGGVSKDYLTSYLETNIDTTNKFKYVILTHYHNDHYNGLLALGDGNIQANYLIDPGGYTLADKNCGTEFDNIQPKDTTCPSAWVINERYKDAIANAAKTYSLKRYQAMNFPDSLVKEMVKTKIPVTTIDSIHIKLICVAAWGYTLGDSGNIIDNWDKKRTSENNASLAFVLEAGAFRYFLGGDLGGENYGSYIDQETTLKEGLKHLYPNAKPYIGRPRNTPGHLCGFKANHHGSKHSNNEKFVVSIRATLCVTSGGRKHKLPSTDFISYLKNSTPVTRIPSRLREPNVFEQGYYFTYPYKNDYDLGLYAKRKIDYGNASSEVKGEAWSYVITVPISDALIDTSKFYVKRINYNGSELPMGEFKCHQE